MASGYFPVLALSLLLLFWRTQVGSGSYWPLPMALCPHSIWAQPTIRGDNYTPSISYVMLCYFKKIRGQSPPIHTGSSDEPLLRKKKNYINCQIQTCITVKPLVKDTLKEDNISTKDDLKVPFYAHSIYEITSERGQPLYKGQSKSSLLCTLHIRNNLWERTI